MSLLFVIFALLMKQTTLKKEYTFEGRGLHSGRLAHMTLCPAPVNTGIVFNRVDLGPAAMVEAVAENVSSTARSTTISKGRVCVRTIEHVLSALTGLGVDNAIIKLDAPEVPILDGSASAYAEAICADGLQEQEEERKWIELDKEVVVENKSRGSYIKFIPSEEPSFEVTIDFNSHVLGVQTFSFSSTTDYKEEVAPCRTFCFFHEIQKLAAFGLVKGGSLNNAIVIVERPASERQLRNMAKAFRQPVVSVSPEGYLSNVVLRFPDECCRHKLLDLMGDLRLIGGFPKAKVVAYKPGHKLNTGAAKQIRNTK